MYIESIKSFRRLKLTQLSAIRLLSLFMLSSESPTVTSDGVCHGKQMLPVVLVQDFGPETRA